MDDPSAVKVTRPILKLLFWGVVFPIATLTILVIGYLVFYIGIEHY